MYAGVQRVRLSTSLDSSWNEATMCSGRGRSVVIKYVVLLKSYCLRYSTQQFGYEMQVRKE